MFLSFVTRKHQWCNLESWYTRKLHTPGHLVHLRSRALIWAFKNVSPLSALQFSRLENERMEIVYFQVFKPN